MKPLKTKMEHFGLLGTFWFWAVAFAAVTSRLNAAS
jgi:hypothetical protein